MTSSGGPDRRFPAVLLAIPATIAVVVASAALAEADAVEEAAVEVAVVEAAVDGIIEGRIEIRETPQRRTADRYRGRGAAPTQRSVQDVPPVVFMEGSQAGTGGWASSGPATLLQQDTLFQPSMVVVPVGGTVDFPNGDDFFHNVFSYSGAKRFDLGRYPSGESKSVVFDQPGIVQVFCEVHEHMRAVIVVTESPYHAVAGEDGAFTIEGVPAGPHSLRIWTADHGEEEVEVQVTDGGTATVNVTLE